MNHTNKIKVIQTLTVAAVIFFILLVSALIINLVKLASASNRKQELEAQLLAADALISQNQEEIDYRESDEYIDRYAREYLNMIGKGDTAFIGG